MAPRVNTPKKDLDPNLRCNEWKHRYDTDQTKGIATQLRVQFDLTDQPYYNYFCGPHAGGQKRKDNASWRKTVAYWFPSTKPHDEAKAESIPQWHIAMAAEKREEAERVAQAKIEMEKREAAYAKQRMEANANEWAGAFVQCSVEEEDRTDGGRQWTVMAEGKKTDNYASVSREATAGTTTHPWRVCISGNLSIYDMTGTRVYPTDLAFMFGQCVQEAAALAEHLNEKARPPVESN